MKYLSTLCFFLLSNLYFSQTSPAQETKSRRMFVEKKTFNKESTTQFYEMNISYPYVTYEITEVGHGVNLGIQQLMGSSINDFQGKVQKAASSKKGFSGFNSLNLDFETYCRTQDVLSLRFKKSTLLDGTTGMTNAYLSLNYDMQTGRLIRLADLFLAEVDFEKELANLLKKSLDNCKIKPSVLFQNFCLSPEYLVFTLDTEANSPRSCEGELKIYWRDIAQLLSPEGIGSRFL